jgi:uncharacterized protein (TIGR04255 family)
VSTPAAPTGNPGDEVLPLGGLPPADRTLLAKPPLDVALIEVRFAPVTEAITTEQMLAMRGFASELVRFDRLEPARSEMVQVNVTPTGPQTTVQQKSDGWRLVTADGALSATLLPEALVIQTRNYLRWSVSLKPPLEALLGALAQVLPPSLVQRIGLRYVDRFVDPSAVNAAAWQGRIDSHLLGVSGHPLLGDKIVGAQQQLEVSLGPTQGAVVRHGPFTDLAVGSVSYLLDIDVYDGASVAFEAAALVATAERLNRTALSLFQAVLTPEYLRSLQPDQSAPEPRGDAGTVGVDA